MSFGASWNPLTRAYLGSPQHLSFALGFGRLQFVGGGGGLLHTTFRIDRCQRKTKGPPFTSFTNPLPLWFGHLEVAPQWGIPNAQAHLSQGLLLIHLEGLDKGLEPQHRLGNSATLPRGSSGKSQLEHFDGNLPPPPKAGFRSAPRSGATLKLRSGSALCRPPRCKSPRNEEMGSCIGCRKLRVTTCPVCVCVFTISKSII